MTKSKNRGIRKRILRKLISIASITLIMLLIVSYGVIARAGRTGSTEVTVRPGDTLWAIAEKYGNYTGDIREFIHQIKRLNGLSSSALSPGQVIKVPLR